MNQSPARRSSFGGMLLRRTKSGDMKKQQQQAKAQELQRQRDAALPQAPPRLPALYNGAPAPQLGLGTEVRPDSLAIISGTTDSTGVGHSSNYSISSTARPSMEAPRSVYKVPPPPPIPNDFDPYVNATSMAHRGRYSYASSAVSSINSPRRVRRRKDPTAFNVLVVGASNSGKTSFLEFLKSALAPPKRRGKPVDQQDHSPKPSPSGNFIPHYLETEFDGERVGLTLWDSEGLEKNVVDLQLRELSSFLESKFEETFVEEMKVVRSPGVQDTHIHAVFLLLDPARLDRNIAASWAGAGNMFLNGIRHSPSSRIAGALDEDLDLQVMRTLHGKTTVIPVIAKADTITTKHMSVLKRAVWDSLKRANLDPLQALGLDEEDDDDSSDRIDEEEENPVFDHSDTEEAVHDEERLTAKQGSSPSSNRHSNGSVRRHKPSEEATSEDEIPFVPMSIISPDLYEPGVIGRKFPWGFADPYNEEHCDFVRLKDAVFNEWRSDLREASREQWYENWRTSRLKQHGAKIR
ncbi:septin [Neurospora crassa OR74A]|uniref:Septin n=2 Tax=Neurospora crassa TaxID=5141 RepID=Q7SFN3_NEUCR|nr:septin [Neurospora crassa OR74A]EAA35627.2 septin [Neurospora crassa OR74A]|eukprot:XP_964863.2 septin [Neurospora crassa OR74A]